MKKSFFTLLVICSIFITSCAPQVTVTSEVTVTSLPPTETPIPTPTLHPQFIALQEQIAASGERFTLLSDGTVQDNATTIPGIQVTADGKVTITVNGEPVEIEQSAINFDNEKGLSIKGYQDTDQNGDWTIEAPPIETVEAAQPMLAILESMNVPVGADKVVEVKMDGDSVICVDVATGDVVCRDGVFNQSFVQKQATENAKNTGLEPKRGNVPPGTPTDNVVDYAGGTGLVKKARTDLETSNGGKDILSDLKSTFKIIMLSEENRSWGVVITVDRNDPSLGRYFVYEKKSGELVIVPIK